MRLILLVALARMRLRLGRSELERALVCDRWVTEAQSRASRHFAHAAELLERATEAR